MMTLHDVENTEYCYSGRPLHDVENTEYSCSGSPTSSHTELCRLRRMALDVAFIWTLQLCWHVIRLKRM
jgi:hypothetical protein